MHGFGSHTFSFINANNERFWVKFHMRTQQGIKNLTDAEAKRLLPKTVKAHKPICSMQLNAAIFQNGKCTFKLCLNLMQKKVPYHPFDLTKVWPKGRLSVD